MTVYDGRREANVTVCGKNISRLRMSRTIGGARHIGWIFP